ncbi:hypothetical protein [Anabaena sp. CCY 0017]|uniref:hypothetical protein n=1 Tax=Anabaena sp. CCY 0017 TaxID=3103866 RepID=UPI0039C61FD5
MSNNLFHPPQNNTPTPFEQDIHDLVKNLKCKVTEIYNKNPPSSSMGIMWIYGSIYPGRLQRENQEMFLFWELVQQKILEKYGHNLTEENALKNLTAKFHQWILDVQLVSTEGKLNKVLTEIESLRIRLGDFRDLNPFQPVVDYFSPPEQPVVDYFKPPETPTPLDELDIDDLSSNPSK